MESLTALLIRVRELRPLVRRMYRTLQIVALNQSSMESSCSLSSGTSCVVVYFFCLFVFLRGGTEHYRRAVPPLSVCLLSDHFPTEYYALVRESLHYNCVQNL